MSDHFFRFPLRALSYGADPLTRLEHLIGYCVMDVGFKELDALMDGTGTPAERRRRAWEFGCKIVNVESKGDGADKSLEERHKAISAHCGSEDQANVSIRADWFWNCIYGLRGKEVEMPLSYREFSVLCAILSKLGNKAQESCTWNEIQRRSLGYATAKDMQARFSLRADHAVPLTRQQIRSTLDVLERNRFFARWAVGKRTACWLTYYSFKMNKHDLATASVEAFKQRRKRGRIVRSEADKALAAKLWPDSPKRAPTSKPPANQPATILPPTSIPPASPPP